VLKALPDHSVDSVVTDPPYALVSIVKRFGGENAAPAKGNEAYQRASAGFMGRTWDTGETAFAVEFWAEVMRVLKPGGHVIAASGTRTYHRLACAIEDAGFEIRDMVSWLYGSGFPKSHAPLHGMLGLPRRMQRATWKEFHRLARIMAGSALKPACEPWVLARKPLCGTIAGNLADWGVGSLNVDGCRVGDEVRHAAFTSLAPCSGNRLGHADTSAARRGTQGEAKEYVGRWPANVVHDGSEDVVDAFPDSNGQQGDLRAHGNCRQSPNGIFGGMRPALDHPARNDSGSAARFFYSAKADAMDRIGSKHPTVKPVDLMQYLCRLITPPGGTVLDPFAGSGTTGEAAFLEGFRCILIEREGEYVEDIRSRLALANRGTATRKRALAAKRVPAARDDGAGQVRLFA
jgi:site-specific DNA-methyltransferase (adenine-specific)